MSTSVTSSAVYVPGQMSESHLSKIVLSFFHAVQSDDELNSAVRDALNSGIALVNSKNWVKMNGTQDIVLVTDIADYPLNYDFKDPLTATRLDVDGNPDGRYKYKESKTFEVEHPSATTSGSPNFYTIYYDQVRTLTLVVAPTNDFVSAWPRLRLRYHRRAAGFSGPATKSTLPPEFDWFLIYHAASIVALSIQPDLHGGFRNMANGSLKMLGRDDRDTLTDWSV